MPRHKDITELAESWGYEPPYAGAQLRVNRKMYYHHGIFTGNSVIHFGEGDPEADMLHGDNNTVREVTLAEFLSGGLLEVRQYSKDEKKLLNPPEEIVRRAREKLGEGGYHFVRNNCECFSNYCAFSVGYSRQAITYTQGIRQRIKQIEDEQKKEP